MSNAVYDTTTNWEKRIAKAERTGKFAADDVARVCCWATCAIGERLQQKGRVTLDRAFNTQFVNSHEVDTLCRTKGIRVQWEYINMYDRKQDRLTDRAAELGFDFMHAVEKHEVVRAKEIFASIKSLREILTSDVQ